MKHILLLVLISCSAGLHGFAGVPTGIPVGVSAVASAASAAQTYSQSNNAVETSTSINLNKVLALVEGEVDDVEGRLCGPGGIDNCSGGIQLGINSTKSFLDENKGDDVGKCENSMNTLLNVYLTKDGSKLKIMPELTGIVNKYSAISGDAPNPSLSKYTVSDVSAEHKQAENSFNNKKINAIANKTFAAQAAFKKASKAFNNNEKTGCINKLPAGTKCSTHPCKKEMSDYLDSFEKYSALKIELFEALKVGMPYAGGQYSVESPNAYLLDCILPSRCKPCHNKYNCCYPMSAFSAPLNSYLKEFNKTVNKMELVVKSSTTRIKALNAKMGKISDKLNAVGVLVKKMSASMTSLLRTCENEIESYAKHEELIREIDNIAISVMIGVAVIETAGVVGGAAGLSELSQLLMLMPKINDNTIGAVAATLSQPLSTAIVDDAYYQGVDVGAGSSLDDGGKYNL